jgi:hypothetical protein
VSEAAVVSQQAKVGHDPRRVRQAGDRRHPLHPFGALLHLIGKEVQSEMAFAEWMAGAAGRTLRVLAGLALIGVGLYFQGVWGWVIAIVGVVPVLAGIFNVCVIAPILGVPFSGRRLAGRRLA